MAPRNKTNKNARSLEDSIDLWTHIRMRRWCKSKVNGMVKQYGDPRVWDDVNGQIIPIGIAEAGKLHGLEINPKTGALVYDGKDVEGTSDEDWNKAPAAGEKPMAIRLEILNMRAAAVGVSIPESNNLDDYERLILMAEGRAKTKMAINVAPENVTRVERAAQPVTSTEVA